MNRNIYSNIKPTTLIFLASLFLLTLNVYAQTPKFYKEGFVFQFDAVPTMGDGKTPIDIPIKRCVQSNTNTNDNGLTDRFGCPMMKNYYHVLAEQADKSNKAAP